MSAKTRPSRLSAVLVGCVGILSTACASMVDVAPRPPGGGGSTHSPVAVDDSPFSVEERARIAAVDPWIEQAAAKHRIDPDLVRGMVWVESRFDPRAESPAGARGLMQLMPDTADWLAPRVNGQRRASSYDPQFNVLAGTLYLNDMLERYKGDVVLALAAYNAGPGNVDRWLREDGELPPRSHEYAALVLAAKTRFETRWRVPAEREHDTIAEAGAVPVRAPAPVVIPDPPARVDEDDVPVRYDLDKVERVEPPRPIEDEVPEPEPAIAPAEAPEPAAGPTLGLGVLPSLGD